MHVSVVIPAYNEESRLPDTLRETALYFSSRPDSFELIVVDDGSTDSTANVARRFADDNPDAQLRVLSYAVNRGKGYAVRHGMTNAIGELRLFCDADLATPIEEFDVLIQAMTDTGAEIAIGSRPLKNSNLLVHQPKYREWLGRIFNSAVQYLAVPGIQDTQCGFKLFTGKCADLIFAECRLNRYAFDSEALYLGKSFGYTIVEVPIRWSHKDGSKVNLMRDGTRMVFDLLTIRLLHRFPSARRTPSVINQSHPEL